MTKSKPILPWIIWGLAIVVLVMLVIIYTTLLLSAPAAIIIILTVLAGAIIASAVIAFVIYIGIKIFGGWIMSDNKPENEDIKTIIKIVPAPGIGDKCPNCGYEGTDEEPLIWVNKELVLDLDDDRYLKYSLLLCTQCYVVSWKPD